MLWKRTLTTAEKLTEDLLVKAATRAQIILQGTLLFSFIPLFAQVAKNPSSESIWAWILWTVTFVLQTILVIIRWKGQYADLVYPVNMTICHLAVALLTQYSYHKTLEILGGITFLVAYMPYSWAIWSTRKLPFGTDGKAEPVKMTWLIWSILDIITWGAMWKINNRNFQIDGCVIGNTVVLILAFLYGKAGWTKVDIFCGVGATFGIFLWWLTGDPTLGMKMTLLTLVFGSIPLFIATWKNPLGESKIAWTIYWSSSIFMLFSFPVWSVKDCAQVGAFFFIQTVMMLLIFVKPWVEKTFNYTEEEIRAESCREIE